MCGTACKCGGKCPTIETKKYIVYEDSCLSLFVDDGGWRGDPTGSEPAGFYDYDNVVELPVMLVTRLEKAEAELRLAAKNIRSFIEHEKRV